MTSVALVTGKARARKPMIAASQPRHRDRNLRSQLIEDSRSSKRRVLLASDATRVIATKGLKGTYNERTSLVKSGLVNFAPYDLLPGYGSLAQMSMMEFAAKTRARGPGVLAWSGRYADTRRQAAASDVGFRLAQDSHPRFIAK